MRLLSAKHHNETAIMNMTGTSVLTDDFRGGSFRGGSFRGFFFITSSLLVVAAGRFF